MNWNKFNNQVSTAILNADRLDDFLKELGCDDFDHDPGSHIYRGKCPVHGGKDKNCQLRSDGDKLPINWRCYSHHCENLYKPSLLGFVRGVLTYQREGALVSSLKEAVHIREAVSCLERFIVGLPAASRKAPTRLRPQVTTQQHGGSWTKEQVRRRLDIPSPYFVSLDFSAAVLDAMDVGHSKKLGRSVVPLYDDTGKQCIGYTARWEGAPCPQCGMYHDEWEDCGDHEPKWRLSPGFPKSSYLYNYAAAVHNNSQFVILGEGAKEVWKLAEIRVTGVACLGSELTSHQADKLAHLKKPILVAFDNDEAGRKGTEVAVRRLSERSVRVDTLPVPNGFKDLAEMPAAEAARWVRGRGW